MVDKHKLEQEMYSRKAGRGGIRRLESSRAPLPWSKPKDSETLQRSGGRFLNSSEHLRTRTKRITEFGACAGAFEKQREEHQNTCNKRHTKMNRRVGYIQDAHQICLWASRPNHFPGRTPPLSSTPPYDCSDHCMHSECIASDAVLQNFFGGRKMSTNFFAHKLFEHSQGSGTSRQNPWDIPGSLRRNPRKTNFRRRARTFRPPPLRVPRRPPPHPGSFRAQTVNLCALFSCLSFARCGVLIVTWVSRPNGSK